MWPTGQAQPLVSTLNAPTGTITANAAVLSAGTGGSVSVFAANDTDLLLDVNGYFAPTGSTGNTFLYTVTLCRALDTRTYGATPFPGTYPRLSREAARKTHAHSPVPRPPSF